MYPYCTASIAPPSFASAAARFKYIDGSSAPHSLRGLFHGVRVVRVSAVYNIAVRVRSLVKRRDRWCTPPPEAILYVRQSRSAGFPSSDGWTGVHAMRIRGDREAFVPATLRSVPLVALSSIFPRFFEEL